MKRFLTLMLVMILIVSVISLCNTCLTEVVIASDTDVSFPAQVGGSTTFFNILKDIWKVFSVIVQILSIGAVVFAGLRYMFASADKKADIKRGIIYLVSGSVIVFGSTFVIDFIVKAFEEII